MTETEIAKEEIVQETQEVVEQSQAQTQEVTQKNNENINWEKANEVMRLQKQRIDELEAKFAKQQEKPPEPDPLEKMDPSEYLTVEQAKMLVHQSAEKKAEIKARQVVEEFATQQKVLQDEQRMRSKHEDFDYVIENFAIPMIKNDPALAHKIHMSKNPAEAAYKLAKISDEYEETMSKQQTSPKAEKIMKNAQRPVSSNAVSASLKTQADDFSKLSREQVWEMSQKFARGA
jgi:hypothetical protein